VLDREVSRFLISPAMERYRLHPDSAAIYFCTFTITDWLPVFVSEAACQMSAKVAGAATNRNPSESILSS